MRPDGARGRGAARAREREVAMGEASYLTLRGGEEFVDVDGAPVCGTGDSLRALMRDVASSDRL